MNNHTTMQDSWVSASDPAKICSFDYEAIQEPTKALMHQAARFLYFKSGRGTIEIDGTPYAIGPDTLVAITPWKISDVTEVGETLQFMKVIYDYQYVNAVLKGMPGTMDEGSELLRFLSMEPVAYLDSVEARYVDELMECLKSELGVESTRTAPPDKPFAQLYTVGKLIELIITYRRYIMSQRGEVDNRKDAAKESSIFSYIYAHSAEKLTLSRLAEVFFMSESTLSKQISETTGSTFMKLLNSIRIEKASDYLIHTDLTLDEIADLVGFVDASHLSKHFSAKVGITPISYRKIYSKSKNSFNQTDKDVAFAVTDYLFKNYQDSAVTASAVASRMGVSVTEMNRLLLYYAEKNFETLLNYIRVNKACELLTGTDYLVIDVALEVGYSNVKTFNMNFFKYTGMTPTEFRDRITLQKTDGSESAGKRTGKRRGG